MNRILLWVPVIAWAGVIFILSHVPSLDSGLDNDFLLRKLAHVIEYAILMFLLYRAFKNSFTLSLNQYYIYPAVVSLVYAISDEYHQTFIQGRHGAISDVFIDAIGIMGVCIWIAMDQKKQTLKK